MARVGCKDRDTVDRLRLSSPHRLRRAPHSPPWPARPTRSGCCHQCGDVLPSWFRANVDLERTATTPSATDRSTTLTALSSCGRLRIASGSEWGAGRERLSGHLNSRPTPRRPSAPWPARARTRAASRRPSPWHDGEASIRYRRCSEHQSRGSAFHAKGDVVGTNVPDITTRRRDPRPP